MITNKRIAILTNLIILDLDNNELITDAGIKNLTNLTTLNLNNNKVITNSGIDNLPNLRHLSLCNDINIRDDLIPSSIVRGPNQKKHRPLTY